MGWIRNTLTALTLSVAIVNCTPDCNLFKDSPEEIKYQRKLCEEQKDKTAKAGEPLKFKDHYFFSLKEDYCKANDIYNLRKDYFELQKIELDLTKYHCFQNLVDARRKAFKSRNFQIYNYLLNRNWCRGNKYKLRNDIKSLDSYVLGM
jgi:hypothetical protein